jgi:protein-S-isoprenylcysteine O-methyltransferase Ste14
MIKLGRALFKSRSYTPIPIILIYPFITKITLATLIIGAILTLFGEVIRIYSVSFIGSISRTRGNSTGKLVEAGPYAVVRNPLYIGNFFIFFGFVSSSNNLIYIGICFLLFIFQYYFIVLYEQDTLQKKFGEVYDNYRVNVHPFIPRFNKLFSKNNYEKVALRKGLRSEKWTLITVLILILIPLILFLFGGNKMSL